jgi:hypothetical protein
VDDTVDGSPSRSERDDNGIMLMRSILKDSVRFAKMVDLKYHNYFGHYLLSKA